MSWNRRELLGSLGVASASTLLWATGCGRPAREIRAPLVATGEVRGWLRDAVKRLAAIYPEAHALSVSRQRVTAASDVLGTGVARASRQGAVLVVRDRTGTWREQATSELTEQGIAASVVALAGTRSPTARAALDFGRDRAPPADLRPIDDRELGDRLGAITRSDRVSSSRIVYAAALIDIEDATVWSIAPGHDQVQRTRRVLQRATRAAWNGSRPVVSEVTRGWVGEVGDHALSADEVTAASEHALLMMTPGPFEDGEHAIVLEPAIGSAILEAAVRGLLTTAAARRPEVTARAALGKRLGAATLTLIDDPTSGSSYGGFGFDDEGEPAHPITLLDHGIVTNRLSDRAGVSQHLASTAGRARRPGHVGAIEPASSHLRLEPGTQTHHELIGDGWVLEGNTGTLLDPASGRIAVGIARAKEIKRGSETGRVFADLELTGDLGGLLTSITGASRELDTSVIRDEVDGEPRWRSITAPWLATRGVVRARRSRA